MGRWSDVALHLKNAARALQPLRELSLAWPFMGWLSTDCAMFVRGHSLAVHRDAAVRVRDETICKRASSLNVLCTICCS